MTAILPDVKLRCDEDCGHPKPTGVTGSQVQLPEYAHSYICISRFSKLRMVARQKGFTKSPTTMLSLHHDIFLDRKL